MMVVMMVMVLMVMVPVMMVIDDHDVLVMMMMIVAKTMMVQVLREAVVMGMPRTRRPWKKVLVVVEGIYSMEGEVADLGPIVRVAKKHKV